ncbi:MAG: sulfurtransferase [Pseudomonadota bacterium]
MSSSNPSPPSESASNTPVFVSPAWAMELASPPLWLDCRFRLDDPHAGRQLFAAGHIAGARFADLDQDLADHSGGRGRHPLPAPEDFAQRCQAWGVGAGPVVVYDDVSGAMAARAWWMLRWLGHDQVYILDGGLAAWEAAGGAMSTDEAGPVEASDTPGPFSGSMPMVTEQQVQALINGNEAAVEGGLMLLDARAADRFRGEQEPIDPIAGHVPGAVNRPFADSLADERLADEVALRALWQDTLGNVAPDQVTHMCGSGVTACFNLACMEHLGLTGSRLYVGSWSEWIANPDNPLAGG